MKGCRLEGSRGQGVKARGQGVKTSGVKGSRGQGVKARGIKGSRGEGVKAKWVTVDKPMMANRDRLHPFATKDDP